MDSIAERMTPTVQTMIVVSATISGLFIFVKPARPWLSHLALNEGFLRGELWQAVTGLFSYFDVVGFLFGLVGFWFFAASVESELGRKRFLTLFFASGVLSNVAVAFAARGLGRPVPAVGNGLAVLALIVAFGRIYRGAEVRVMRALSFSAMQVARFWVILLGVVALISRDWPYLAGLAVATVVGYVLGGTGGLREAYDSLRARRARQRYKVLDGGRPGRAKTRSQKYWN
jgi:membrane associated rhomboid family serine protease